VTNGNSKLKAQNSKVAATLVLSFAFCFLSFEFLYAAEGQFFPTAHELFEPLRADPRELQYALRLVVPVSHKVFGEAAVGDYFGLYRWSLDEGRAVQVGVGGGAFGRFDLTAKTNDMQVADYYGNVPFDFRSGRWSARFLIYHTSSHLGDDFLSSTGQRTSKHSWDNLRWLLSFEPTSAWRLYGGYTYVFRSLPGSGRSALQGGLEWQSAYLAKNHVQLYWANDFQSWERTGWNPMFNSQAGVTFVNKPEDRRGISLFVEFETGRQPHGQFYLQQETHWGAGVKLRFT
jgi:hypothetical protein